MGDGGMSATRESFRRLRAVWAEADEDTRLDVSFYFAGLALMAVAIVLQFGWLGGLFVTGAIFRAAFAPPTK
jgi:glucokinase